MNKEFYEDEEYEDDEYYEDEEYEDDEYYEEDDETCHRYHVIIYIRCIDNITCLSRKLSRIMIDIEQVYWCIQQNKHHPHRESQ